MSELKIKVGKTYVNRDGDLIPIAYKLGTPASFPYLDNRGHSYQEDGTYWLKNEHPYDLIQEAPLTPTHGVELNVLANKILDSYTYEELLQCTYDAIVTELKKKTSKEYIEACNRWEV